MPTFLAPLRATVATGTPPGICSIDKTESQPSMELMDFIGTPMTGRGDNAAIIAWAGIQRYKKKLIDNLNVEPKSRWPLDKFAPYMKGPGLKL